MNRYIFGSITFALLLAGNVAYADVRLPAVIGDHMVLQRGMKAPVWGWADPGESVTVTLTRTVNRNTITKRVTTVAGNDGVWKAQLPDLRMGDSYEMTVAGKNTITVRDVLVGDVWVCSGQSNMEWPVSASDNPEKEIAAANYPKIRLFTVTKRVSTEPLKDVEGKWEVCRPQTVRDFSAVGYFFGRELHRSLNVPIGLIDSSWGGTPAESWTSRSVLEADADFKPIFDRWDKAVVDYPTTRSNYETQLAAWEKASAEAKVAGTPEPPRPWEPAPPPNNPWMPTSLYNAMIAPLQPYGIKGAIWYQGESNANRAYQYRKLFPAMIRNWRQTWGQGDFPFLFVQLANFMPTVPEPGESDWAELREAQAMTLQLPKTAMASAIDIGDAADIHPRNKQEVGRRLALGALSVAYRQQNDHSGPTYRSMKVEGNRVRLRFRHGDGLMTKRGGDLKGFAIAGEDRKFVWATAKIEGDSVVVWNDAVEKPVAVRYAWANNPEGNLYNAAGLPAHPFRTDGWPGVTVNNR